MPRPSRLMVRSGQLYKVAPLECHADENAVLEAGLADEVTGLGGTLFAEVAKSAQEIWRRVYMGKTEVIHKALSPHRTLYGKLVGLSFVEPHVAPVADIIKAAFGRMPAKGTITGTDLFLLQGLICLLSDSEALVLHAQKPIEGYGPATVLDAPMRYIRNAIEEWHVERRISAIYPGCRQNLDWLIRLFFVEEVDTGAGEKSPALGALRYILLTVCSWDVAEVSGPRTRTNGKIWCMEWHTKGQEFNFPQLHHSFREVTVKPVTLFFVKVLFLYSVPPAIKERF